MNHIMEARGHSGWSAFGVAETRGQSLFVALEEERRIVAAEAKVVRDYGLERLADGRLHIGRVVEIELRVGRLVVDRRRNLARLEHLDRDRGLDGASCAQEVARHRLGARDLELVCVVAEGALDRQRLELVVERRGRTVRVDVADVLLGDASEVDGHLEACCEALTLRVRRSDVVRVARGAVSRELAVDFGTARLCVLLRLDEQRARALTHDEARARRIERARRSLRVVVHVGAHSFHVAEACVRERRDGCLRATAEHDVSDAALDVFHRLADGVRPRRARGHDTKVGPLGTQLDGNHARRCVANHHRDEEGRDAPRPLREHHLGVLLERVDAANARSHQHAELGLVDLVEVELAILKRLLCCRHRQLRVPVVALRFLWVHVLVKLEALYLRSDLTLERLRVERFNARNPRFPREEVDHHLIDVVANGSDSAHAGHDHLPPAVSHCRSRARRRGTRRVRGARPAGHERCRV
mmetsp:Transcript_13849/g.35900  ORF Transcript_13849/g.35900 Transcript_13849/m.35900 type:complete len:471 (-) Transcript_13849:72-1484(-)